MRQGYLTSLRHRQWSGRTPCHHHHVAALHTFNKNNEPTTRCCQRFYYTWMPTIRRPRYTPASLLTSILPSGSACGSHRPLSSYILLLSFTPYKFWGGDTGTISGYSLSPLTRKLLTQFAFSSVPSARDPDTVPGRRKRGVLPLFSRSTVVSTGQTLKLTDTLRVAEHTTPPNSGIYRGTSLVPPSSHVPVSSSQQVPVPSPRASSSCSGRFSSTRLSAPVSGHPVPSDVQPHPRQ